MRPQSWAQKEPALALWVGKAGFSYMDTELELIDQLDMLATGLPYSLDKLPDEPQNGGIPPLGGGIGSL